MKVIIAAIQNWHPIKIIMIWVIDLAVLLSQWRFCPGAREFGCPSNERAIYLWIFLSIPVFVITWIWASGRENKTAN